MKTLNALNTAVNYVRKHLVRFLLIGVVLTAGLTLRMAAFAKYSAYLNDFTSTVSGDFFFTSDYLIAPENRTPDNADYRINSWKGQAYEIGVEIRNYENSLRFNHAGTDFFYWLDVAVYQDVECTTPDTRFLSEVDYEFVGATDGDGKEYGFMPGLDEFDHTDGKQEVKVKITPTVAISTGSCYMKITAHTVPLTDVGKLDFENGISPTTSRGVYSATQEAVFMLNITSTEANITTELYAGSTSDYTVRYRVLCNSSEGTGGSVQVKTYYRADRLTPDISLGNNYAESASYTGPYKAADGWRYVQATINVGGSEDLYFYKKSLSLSPVVGESDFGAVVLKTEDIDTTQYSISAAPGAGGSVASFKNGANVDVTQAAMGTVIYATITPDEGYMVNTIAVKDTSGSPVTVSPAGENRYSFEMTNSNVTVLPTFVRKVQIAESENGTVSATPKGATAGTTVYLTIEPADGYMLSSILLNDSDSALTEITETLYSFTMPETAVNITATFTEMPQGD